MIPPRGRTVRIDTTHEDENALRKLKALASEPRLRILNMLGRRAYNLSEMSRALGIHVATIALHIGILEKAGLVVTEQRPGNRGTQKICARPFAEVNIGFPREDRAGKAFTEFMIPVGAFTDFEVFPTCGMLGPNGVIGELDDPKSFYDPQRFYASLVWFQHGYLEYKFPNRLTPEHPAESLHVEAELCSEAPLHHDDWPSDVTLWINGVEVGTYTSPADFGDQRGRLTPAWWASHSTQYGLLKSWDITEGGSFMDGKLLSPTRLNHLHLAETSYVTMRIGVKKGADHRGGINLFGKTFGNHPQDIRVSFQHG